MTAFDTAWDLMKSEEFDDSKPNPNVDRIFGLSNQMVQAALNGRVLPDYIEIQEGNPHLMNPHYETMSYDEAKAKGMLEPYPDDHPLSGHTNNVNILDKRTGKITNVGLYRLSKYLNGIWREYQE